MRLEEVELRALKASRDSGGTGSAFEIQPTRQVQQRIANRARLHANRVLSPKIAVLRVDDA